MPYRYLFSWFLAALLPLAATPLHSDEYTQARQHLLSEIERDAQETSLYLDREALDPRVMAVIGRVPRHEFVPANQRSNAYRNRPLPIGHGQTISQPYIVALMTDLIAPQPDHRVLEIGTGSGYQAAVLAELTGQVYSIEIIEELGEQATKRLARLGYCASRFGAGRHFRFAAGVTADRSDSPIGSGRAATGSACMAPSRYGGHLACSDMDCG